VPMVREETTLAPEMERSHPAGSPSKPCHSRLGKTSTQPPRRPGEGAAALVAWEGSTARGPPIEAPGAILALLPAPASHQSGLRLLAPQLLQLSSRSRRGVVWLEVRHPLVQAAVVVAVQAHLTGRATAAGALRGPQVPRHKRRISWQVTALALRRCPCHITTQLMVPGPIARIASSRCTRMPLSDDLAWID